ncbi:MAG: HesA/MoeB/ThiF family protein [Candidatus Bathyarchaeota archaeon]|nr:HesA/MoeB/ThiF family protein [Candidatus Bathyarchaeota archaeon]MDH5687882.1 HesA/MoeB/ThiF family protein [Candidatus Bathyarchaeota archaeon]
MKLRRDEMERYDRQIRIGSFGLEGQLKLKGAKVAVAGAGGLGCSATVYLAAAGIGHMTIIDEENVELSNLNRQIGHWNRDIGTAKAVSLSEKIRELNPGVELEPVTERITLGTVRDLISGSTVVLDCMDNWETRFMLNKACVAARIPLVHAGVHSLYGQITTVLPGKGPCLRCILPETPQSEDRIPILGVTAGTLGLLEALEAIKIITGMGQPLVGRMLYFDGETTSFYEINVSKREDCPVCGSIK